MPKHTAARLQAEHRQLRLQCRIGARDAGRENRGGRRRGNWV